MSSRQALCEISTCFSASALRMAFAMIFARLIVLTVQSLLWAQSVSVLAFLTVAQQGQTLFTCIHHSNRSERQAAQPARILTKH